LVLEVLAVAVQVVQAVTEFLELHTLEAVEEAALEMVEAPPT
jgi:hypothetical protein